MDQCKDDKSIKPEGLTHKQIAFVESYVHCWNATQAYSKVYGIDLSDNYDSAKVSASKLLKKKSINKYIKHVKSELKEDGLLNIGADLIQLLIEKYGDIKTAQKVIKISIHSLIDDIDSKQELINLRRGGFSEGTRYSILHRSGFKCQACGAKPHKDNNVQLNIDHIVPVSWGGSNDSENLQVLCFDCNVSKGNRFMFDHNKDQQLDLFTNKPS